MDKVIDARGQQCPQPVVLAKNALKEINEIIVIVDNEIASKNLEKLAKSLKADFESKKKGESFEIKIIKAENKKEDCGCVINNNKIVICFKSEYMGGGDNELGRLLMNAYIHTICEMDIKPDVMIFYNSAVKLTVNNSDTVADIKKLEDSGVEVYVCGTCINFYNLKNSIGAGIISNMYDISKFLVEADKIIYP